MLYDHLHVTLKQLQMSLLVHGSTADSALKDFTATLNRAWPSSEIERQFFEVINEMANYDPHGLSKFLERKQEQMILYMPCSFIVEYLNLTGIVEIHRGADKFDVRLIEESDRHLTAPRTIQPHPSSALATRSITKINTTGYVLSQRASPSTNKRQYRPKELPAKRVSTNKKYRKYPPRTYSETANIGEETTFTICDSDEDIPATTRIKPAAKPTSAVVDQSTVVADQAMPVAGQSTVVIDQATSAIPLSSTIKWADIPVDAPAK